MLCKLIYVTVTLITFRILFTFMCWTTFPFCPNYHHFNISKEIVFLLETRCIFCEVGTKFLNAECFFYLFRLWQKFCSMGDQHPRPHPVTNEVLIAGTCYRDSLISGLNYLASKNAEYFHILCESLIIEGIITHQPNRNHGTLNCISLL
jgi:hypothetical protein